MGVLLLVAITATPVSIRLWHLPQNVERVLSAVNQGSARAGSFKSCFLTTQNDALELFDRDNCLKMSSTQKNYIVIGDSHANDLVLGLKKTNPQINFLHATSSGCKPVLVQDGGERRCRELIDMIFRDFLPNHQVDTILLAARWLPEDLPSLKETVQGLSRYGRHIIVFGPRVEYKYDLPWVLAISMLKGNPSLVDSNRKNEQKRTDELFRTQLAGMNVRYFSLYHALCEGKKCSTTDKTGMPLSFDYGHFTENGSIFVAQSIKASGAF
jgi:hypothetical protein